MATNPMQRQARNSFLLGMVVMLLIAGLIVGFLYMQLNKLKKENDTYKSSIKKVYVLNQDVDSGAKITEDMFTSKEVTNTAIPSNATTDIAATLNSTDKEVIAKVDMKANTVLTMSLITTSDNKQTADVRQQEYNMLVLPTDLITGDFVDVRLMLPTGQDYIVVAKKSVTVPVINGEYSADTIQMNLAEEEILSMSNAIVEAYKIQGSKLYITKYTEAGIQEAATPTYVVNSEVANLIDSDPNIVNEAKNALAARYTERLKNMRSQHINSALSNYGNDDNVESQMEESITATQEQRQEYLQTLTVTE